MILLMFGSLVPAATGATSFNASLVRSTTLFVFSDGTAEANQTVSLVNMSSITLPLLSSQVGNILAVSSSGAAVSYQISGGNITLSTFGISRLSLIYDTDALTSKQGSVWALAFNSPYNITLILPFQSTVLSLSRTPTSLLTVSGKPELRLAPGAWQVSYGLPFYIQSSTATSTTSSPTNPSAREILPMLSYWQLLALAAVAAALAGVGLYGYHSRSKFDGRELRPDDREILNFIREKGGSVSEVEIRERFSLPRTSAWRQPKRLEKLGLVRVTKVGKQNQIELAKPQPEPEP
jgi:uncharacterized membrane protein